MNNQIQPLQQITDLRALANACNVPVNKLTWAIWRSKPEGRYKEFVIKKKNGEDRVISSPNGMISQLQKTLLKYFENEYHPQKCVHGFVKNRDIVTNASRHTRSTFVLNVDIDNYFGSINFGRVRGMLMANPYQIEDKTATAIAQICCHNNKLPQGACTSPILANMVTARLDGQLTGLARKHRLIFSRYADDITFSTKRDQFPEELAIFDDHDSGTECVLGKKLASIFSTNGFKINHSKTRIQRRGIRQRQEVTGLVVNVVVNTNKKYYDQVRAMLHAWEKFGEDSCLEVFTKHYDTKNRFSENKFLYREVVKGKLEHIRNVRGGVNWKYRKLLKQYCALSGTLSTAYQ